LSGPFGFSHSSSSDA
jgi:hypothetical protein